MEASSSTVLLTDTGTQHGGTPCPPAALRAGLCFLKHTKISAGAGDLGAALALEASSGSDPREAGAGFTGQERGRRYTPGPRAPGRGQYR